VVFCIKNPQHPGIWIGPQLEASSQPSEVLSARVDGVSKR